MIGDDHVEAARVGVVYGFVGGDASVARDNELRAVLDDGLESLDMHAVTLLAANRDVIDDISAQGLQRLHQHSCGGLPVYVEVAPDADHFVLADCLMDPLDSRLDARKRRERKRIRMQECTRG